ncbi:unnamed protein product [Orchesella dallaii]|uniref:Uncharacterized protein n=1 Tax=Orchesella dallaii TaxID=48710 RepID=A0ABP1QVS9_9HEXA
MEVIRDLLVQTGQVDMSPEILEISIMGMVMIKGDLKKLTKYIETQFDVEEMKSRTLAKIIDFHLSHENEDPDQVQVISNVREIGYGEGKDDGDDEGKHAGFIDDEDDKDDDDDKGDDDDKDDDDDIGDEPTYIANGDEKTESEGEKENLDS